MGSQTFSMSTLLLLLIGFSATLAAVSEPTSNITQIIDHQPTSNITQIIDHQPTSNISQIFDPPITPNISQIFEDWMKKRKRVYSSSEEKARRFELFKKHYLDVQKRNKEEGKSYRLHRFADLSPDDVHQGCTEPDGPIPNFTTIPMLNYSNSLVQRSDCQGRQVDWSKDTWIENGQEKKFVPSPLRPVEDQFDVCGACWAFSSVVAIEAAFRLANGPDVQLRPLSVQQILDCAPGARCNGGQALDAYAYVMKNGGLTLSRNYRYTEKNGTCDQNRARRNLGGSIEGFMRVIPANDDNALELALCRGPVTASVATNTTDNEFSRYAGGMYRGPCGEKVDHSVVVVGFGVENDGTKYWKIQNSWGEEWGEDGYMKMSNDAARECGLTATAAFPVVNYENWKSSN